VSPARQLEEHENFITIYSLSDRKPLIEGFSVFGSLSSDDHTLILLFGAE